MSEIRLSGEGLLTEFSLKMFRAYVFEYRLLILSRWASCAFIASSNCIAECVVWPAQR